MKTIKQLYHEHKIITLILTSPVWLFVLFFHIVYGKRDLQVDPRRRGNGSSE